MGCGRVPAVFGPFFGLIVFSVGLAFAAGSPLTTVETTSVILQTDLSPLEAKQLASRLGDVSGQLEEYWGRPLVGRVQIRVVGDLGNWPEKAIPAEARQQITAKAGTTITERETLDGRVQSIRSTVYAIADGRTPQHEFVHAFCWQTFGRVGPDWFAEGMAEVFANRRPDAKGVQAPAWMIKYLRDETSPPTPGQIVRDDLGQRKLWQKYAHRWALCYLLTHHPRYADNFQKFGKRLLREDDTDFFRNFADAGEPLARDFRRFLREVAAGYEFSQ